MTISVTITNNDKARTIEVRERNFYKEAGRPPFEGAPTSLGPGVTRTFTCYMLRDLIVSELEPSRR